MARWFRTKSFGEPARRAMFRNLKLKPKNPHQLLPPPHSPYFRVGSQRSLLFHPFPEAPLLDRSQKDSIGLRALLFCCCCGWSYDWSKEDGSWLWGNCSVRDCVNGPPWCTSGELEVIVAFYSKGLYWLLISPQYKLDYWADPSFPWMMKGDSDWNGIGRQFYVICCLGCVGCRNKFKNRK